MMESGIKGKGVKGDVYGPVLIVLSNVKGAEVCNMLALTLS